MKRWLRLVWATIRLNWYLLWRGMWRGECGYNLLWNDKVVYLAASTGSVFDGSHKIVKVFWDETGGKK